MDTLFSKIETLELTPTAWAKFPHVDAVEPLNDKDYEILNEIRQVLERYDAINRFGVNLIHRHFDIIDNEIILEETDVEQRVQQIHVIDATNIDRTSILETQWVFNGQKGTECRRTCVPENYAHPSKHIPYGV